MTVLADGDPVDAVHSTPTAQALANRTRYLSDNLLGIASVASAAGTTTLVATSANKQVLTGTLAQSFVLPDETTLIAGRTFEFFNRSTGALTVKDSSGATLFVMPAPVGASRAGYAVACSVSLATATGNWRYFYDTPGQAPATATNDAAAAGNVGELFLQSRAFASRAAVTAMVGTVATNVLTASLDLTPGDWEISGCGILMSTGAGTDDLYLMVSKVSAVTPTNYAGALMGVPTAGEISYRKRMTGTGSVDMTPVAIPAFAVSIAANTSFFLTAKNDTGNAGWDVWGYLTARRVR